MPSTFNREGRRKLKVAATKAPPIGPKLDVNNQTQLVDDDGLNPRLRQQWREWSMLQAIDMVQADKLGVNDLELTARRIYLWVASDSQRGAKDPIIAREQADVE
jgi:hypothetical protein